jgi:hypothetical protein
VARTLSETRDALLQFETSALVDVAERIAPQLPRHYVSEPGILYNVGEVDGWLMDR